MKNMPSVMKEMPDGASHPVSGKKMRRESQSASVNGLDFSSSAIAPIPSSAFHRLFQDNVHVHDRAGAISLSPNVAGQDREGTAGETLLLRPGGERRPLSLAGTKNRLGKGKSLSTGVEERTGKTIAMEESLNGNPSLALSSMSISPAEHNGERSLRLSKETRENHARPQNVPGKRRDHLRSGLRPTGEYPVARGDGGSGENAAVEAADGSVKEGRPDDADDAIRRLQRNDTVHGQENRGSSDDSSRFSALGEGSGKRVRAAKTAPPLSAPVAEANAAPLSSGSENGAGVSPPGRLQHASATPPGHSRSAHRYRREGASFPEGKGGSISDAAIDETGGEARTALPEDAGGVTGSIHGAEALYGRGGTGRADDSSLLSLLGKEMARNVRVSGEDAPRRSAAAAVSSREPAPMSGGSEGETGIPPAGFLHNISGRIHNHPRAVRRHSSEYSIVPGEKAGPDKKAAILEMEGSDKTVHAGDIDGDAQGVPGAETGHYEEPEGRLDGSPLLSLLKEGPGEHPRRAVVGEKGSFISALSGVPPAEAASISAGSDYGEGVLSPGRQALLMAEVVDTARPLAQQGGGRIRISLSPPSLGALEIDIRVKKEGVELFVVANNSDVQQTLCSHVDQLRKALVEQGLNMDRFQVVVGDPSDGQQGRDPRQEGTSGGHREAWSEQGYLPGLGGDNMNDKTGSSASSGSYSSVGAINLFI